MDWVHKVITLQVANPWTGAHEVYGQGLQGPMDRVHKVDNGPDPQAHVDIKQTHLSQ